MFPKVKKSGLDLLALGQEMAMRKQERTRLTDLLEDDLLEDLQRHLGWLNAEIAVLDKRIAQAIAADPRLTQACRILRSLPGVGPVTAQKILEWRSAHGAFASVDELLEVDGIGEKTLADIAPHVTL